MKKLLFTILLLLTFQQLISQSEEEVGIFVEAILAFEKGDYIKTLDLLKPIEASSETEAFKYFLIGKTNERLKRYIEAIKNFEIATSYDSKTAKEAFYELSRIYIKIEQYDKGLKCVNQSIKIDSTIAKYFATRGGIYKAIKEYEKAVSDYNYALSIDSLNIDAYSGKGSTLLAQGKYELALNALIKAISLAEKCFGVAHFNKGLVYYNMKEYQNALSEFEKAKDCGVNQEVKLYKYIGLTCYYLGDYNKGEEYYNQTILLDKNNEELLLDRSIVFFAMKEHDKAISDLDKAIEINPNYVLGYYNRGVIYKRIGEMEAALIDFSRTIELDSVHISAYIERGIVFSEMGFNGKSLEDFNKVIEIDSSYSLAYINRASLKYKINDINGACRDWKEVLRLEEKKNEFGNENWKTRIISSVKQYCE